ncbi:hypothetical protein CEXT_262061 [Caerostris extrusa]|uniref:Uncharacterized protein n=1 Tax=Caerostris extrusa TaxID=172846 RepID=A0AAV4RT75_CAEEX|nr:hypothetical protein CEXT_262061 [Caerostris extrusa]
MFAKVVIFCAALAAAHASSSEPMVLALQSWLPDPLALKGLIGAVPVVATVSSQRTAVKPRCPSCRHWRRRPIALANGLVAGNGLIANGLLEMDLSPTDSLEMEFSPTDSSEMEFSPTESSPETESSPTVLLPDTESLDPSLLATVFLEPLTDSRGWKTRSWTWKGYPVKMITTCLYMFQILIE